MTDRDTVDSMEPAAVSARFFHLSGLPVARRRDLAPASFESIDAQLAGCTVEELRRLRAGFQASAAQAARELAARPTVAQALEALVLPVGATLVAFGDSITEDSLSWATQLAHLLADARPDLQARVVNAGVTGHTTLEAICRFDLVAREEPAYVIQLLGTNDARRHGAAGVTTTSPAETRRNLTVLRDLVAQETPAQHLVLTPPPVIEEWANSWGPFRDEGIGWHAQDVVDVAATIRNLHPDAVDVHAVIAELGPRSLLLPDGVHPSLHGQSVIAELVLHALAGLPSRTGPAVSTSTVGAPPAVAPHPDSTARRPSTAG